MTLYCNTCSVISCIFHVHVHVCTIYNTFVYTYRYGIFTLKQTTTTSVRQTLVTIATICIRTSAAVEYTDSAVPAVVDLVVPQDGVAVRLDPHARHGVVEDLVVLYDAQPPVVHENAPVLAAPYPVPFYQRVATGSGGRNSSSNISSENIDGWYKM